MICHFRNKSFQAINCSSTDNVTQTTKTQENTKTNPKQTGPSEEKHTQTLKLNQQFTYKSALTTVANCGIQHRHRPCGHFVARTSMTKIMWVPSTHKKQSLFAIFSI